MDSSKDLFGRICRLCLSVNISKSVSLFDTNDELNSYGQAVVKCTDVQITKSPSIPPNMCYKCLHQLKLCILFRKRCEKSQNYLSSLNHGDNSKDDIVEILYFNKSNVLKGNNTNNINIHDTDTVSANEGIMQNGKVKIEILTSDAEQHISLNEATNNQIEFNKNYKNREGDIFSSKKDNINDQNHNFKVRPSKSSNIIETQNKYKETSHLSLNGIFDSEPRSNHDLPDVSPGSLSFAKRKSPGHVEPENDNGTISEIKETVTSYEQNLNITADKESKKCMIKKYSYNNLISTETTKKNIEEENLSNILADDLIDEIKNENQTKIATELFEIMEGIVQKEFEDSKKAYRKESVEQLKNNIIKLKHNSDLLRVSRPNENDIEIAQDNILEALNEIEVKQNLIKHIIPTKKVSKTKQKTPEDSMPKKRREMITPKSFPIQTEDMKPLLICEICKKNFSTRGSLRNHLQKHGDVAQFICEQCGRSFFSSGDLLRHTTYAHRSGPQHSCDQCDYKTTLMYELKEHRRLHSEERPFGCELCGQTFRRRQTLRRHQIIHGDKKFQCPNCPYKCFKASELREHDNSTHTRRYMYACTLCSRQYARNTSVRAHLNKDHDVPRAKQGRISRVSVDSKPIDGSTTD